MSHDFSWLPDGATRVVGIVGDPVEQVKSPTTLTAGLRRRGLNVAVLPFAVRPGDLRGFLDGIRLSPTLVGIIATIPHKPAALAAADEATARARGVGAANLLRRTPTGWAADMVDGVGFLGGLRAGGCDPAGRTALLVGAGGVGAAIAWSLAEAGLRRLLIHDVDEGRAAALAARLPAGCEAVTLPVPDAAGCDLAVNATPLGMGGDGRVPFDVAALPSHAAVAEVVMTPEWTPLLLAARGRGLRTFPGRLVLEHQFAATLAHLFPDDRSGDAA